MGGRTGTGKLGCACRPSWGRRRRIGPFDALDVRRLAPTSFFRTLSSRYFQHLRPLSELLPCIFGSCAATTRFETSRASKKADSSIHSRRANSRHDGTPTPSGWQLVHTISPSEGNLHCLCSLVRCLVRRLDCVARVLSTLSVRPFETCQEDGCYEHIWIATHGSSCWLHVPVPTAAWHFWQEGG
jgi:hypothetical protein